MKRKRIDWLLVVGVVLVAVALAYVTGALAVIVQRYL